MDVGHFSGVRTSSVTAIAGAPAASARLISAAATSKRCVV
jgi:hypothetical protein